MKNEFLDIMLTACFSLRRLKKITVLQENGEWNPRSNVHCLIVMPFGHQKSTITRKISDKKAVYKCDTFTEASFKGTITKEGDIVPPIMKDFGGKVVFIDEWNSIGFSSQNALLSAMENQEFNRSLGYTVRKEWNYKDEFMNIIMKDNVIKADYCFFSLVAFAMSFPTNNNSQSSMALLSRFIPIFVESNKELIRAMMCGRWKVNSKDYSNPIEEVIISKEIFHKLNDKIWEYIETHKLMPDDPDLNGFLIRTQSDIVRLSIMYYYKEHWESLRSIKKKSDRIITIDDEKYLNEAMQWYPTIMNQYLNPKTKGKIKVFLELLKQFPNESDDFYAKKIGVTKRTIRNYRIQMENRGGGNFE
jgi:hypothetical protein